MNRYEVIHDMALHVAETYVNLSRSDKYAVSKEKLIKDFEDTYKEAVKEYNRIPDNELSFGN